MTSNDKYLARLANLTKNFDYILAFELLNEIMIQENNFEYILSPDEELLFNNLTIHVRSFAREIELTRLSKIKPDFNISERELKILENNHRVSLLGDKWHCYKCGMFPSREHKLYEFYKKETDK